MIDLELTLTDVCPDCGTSLHATSGPAPCETCWRVVPASVRGRDGRLSRTGGWMRLPPGLQRVTGLVSVLMAACWTAGRIDAGRDA